MGLVVWMRCWGGGGEGEYVVGEGVRWEGLRVGEEGFGLWMPGGRAGNGEGVYALSAGEDCGFGRKGKEWDRIMFFSFLSGRGL